MPVVVVEPVDAQQVEIIEPLQGARLIKSLHSDGTLIPFLLNF